MAKSKDSNKSGKKDKKLKGMAAKADKYDCYQQSVQEPEHEVESFQQFFKEIYKKKPLTLREDFCGTFAVCCEWAKSHANRQAWGVDLSEEALQWGKDNNLSQLEPEAASRVKVLKQDVREKNTPPVDILAAENFSWWIFMTRKEMIEYLKAAHANLKDEGLLVLDMMGGMDCYESESTEKRTIIKGKKGFKYLGEQASFNPVTSECEFKIHFKFGDGSKMKNAFEYNWRLWTMPEVREMLAEAGFKKSVIYCDLAEEDEDADWTAVEEIENDDCWICYIVGVK